MAAGARYGALSERDSEANMQPQLEMSDSSDSKTALVGDHVRGQHAEHDVEEDLQIAKREQPFIPDSDSSLQETETADSRSPWKRIGLKVALSVSVFLLVSFLLETFAEKTVNEVSEKVMDWIGLPGLFMLVFLADGIPQPFTYVPLIFMAVKGSVEKPLVFFVCAVASYCAALAGYMIGFKIRSHERGEALFHKMEEDYPEVPDIMERRGAIGVALAAMLPVPLAIATWTAGSFQIYFPHFLMAGMCRMPKIAVFVLLSRSPSARRH